MKVGRQSPSLSYNPFDVARGTRSRYYPMSPTPPRKPVANELAPVGLGIIDLNKPPSVRSLPLSSPPTSSRSWRRKGSLGGTTLGKDSPKSSWASLHRLRTADSSTSQTPFSSPTYGSPQSSKSGYPGARRPSFFSGHEKPLSSSPSAAELADLSRNVAEFTTASKNSHQDARAELAEAWKRLPAKAEESGVVGGELDFKQMLDMKRGSEDGDADELTFAKRKITQGRLDRAKDKFKAVFIKGGTGA